MSENVGKCHDVVSEIVDVALLEIVDVASKNVGNLSGICRKMLENNRNCRKLSEIVVKNVFVN